jgi:hypothetical protein
MPRKTFTAGEVLQASDVNTYLSNEALLVSSTATSYSVLPADRYETLVFTSASNVTVTIGTATAFEPGERIDIIRDGAGTVTITRDGTATNFAGRGTAADSYTIAQQYDGVTVLCTAANTYRIIGNATAV